MFYAEPCELLRDVLGVELAEDVHASEAPKIRMDEIFECEPCVEVVTAAGAKVLGTFSGGIADGRPAVLEHVFGKGRVWYVAGVSRDANAKVLTPAARAARLEQLHHQHEKLSVVPDLHGLGTWYINHGETPARVNGIDVPPGDFVFVRR